MPAAKIFETFKLLKSVNLSEWVNLHVIVFRLHEKQLRQSSSADSTVLGRKASGRCSYWSSSSHPYELTAAPYRPKLVWPWVQRRNLRAQISGAHLCLLGVCAARHRWRPLTERDRPRRSDCTPDGSVFPIGSGRKMAYRRSSTLLFARECD